MLIFSSYKKYSSGFTLLEIMLVILLMGMTAAAVTLTMGVKGPKEQMQHNAKQFIASVELILDEAVLSGKLIGIEVDNHSYQFVYRQNNKWQAFTSDRLLAKREMPPEITLELQIDGLPLVQNDEEDETFFDKPFEEADLGFEKEANPIDPQVLIFPSGEMTNFTLNFYSKNDDNQEIKEAVNGNALGRLTLVQEK